MDLSSFQPIEAAVTLSVTWIALGVIGLAFVRAPRVITGVLFPAGAVVSLALAATGLWAISAPPSAAILPAGLPDLPFHVRVDALSGFFLLLLGGVSFGISLFCRRLLPRHGGHGARAAEPAVPRVPRQHGVRADRRRRLPLHDHVGVDGAVVVFPRHHRAPRRAEPQGGLHLSAGRAYRRDRHPALLRRAARRPRRLHVRRAARGPSLTAFWATVAFLLAFFGFGAKAGMLPLHVWLPEAHPAAPSPVSALMSGVMLKTAIYGMVRVIYDLIGGIRWEWGLTVLLFGAATSLFGVLFALMQHDLKRLLAYHSVENIGIILIGIGLSMVFIGSGHPVAGVLGLIAGAVSHAQSRGVQGPAVPRRRRHPEVDRVEEPERDGRADPLPAAHRALFPDRRAGDLGAAAVERLRLRVAHVPGVAAGAAAAEQRGEEPRAASSPPCSRSPGR